jgi:hypothetical protein
MINPDKSTEFVNFKFRGISFSAWMDKKFDPMKSIVGITEFTEGKKGKVTYQIPVFKAFKLTEEIDEEALQYDIILQEYLKEYFAKEPEKEIAHAEAANPLTDPVEPTFKAKDEWQGGSKSKLPPTKEELIKKAKDAMVTRNGKQDVKSMSNPEDLPGDEYVPPQEDNQFPDDLPFILTIPIALGLLIPFM